MTEDLHKLRIDKHHKARRDDKAMWPWALLILLLIGGATIFWGTLAGSSAVAVQTIRVHMPEGVAAEHDLKLLDATGYIIAAHKIELASKVIGRVAWVGVEMGDKISKDQVLVRLEDDEYKARVAMEQGQLDAAQAKLDELVAGSRPEEIATSQAALDKARAELAVAEINYKRLADLEESHSVSRQQIDDAESLVHTRTAEVESQKQQLEMATVGPRKEEIAAQRGVVKQLDGSLALAMVDLNDTVIHSPISGTVLERNVEVGEFVTNGFVGDRGAKGYVLSIADLNDLQVELDVSQNDFAKVQPHQPCWIVTDAYPDRRYDGIVDLISPEANRQKATIQVRVRVTNPDDRLRPDMNATVSFLASGKLAATQSAANTAGDRPALRIPSAAVQNGAVLVVENGKAVKRVVTLGTTSGNGEVEVQKGLIGGEDLIVNAAGVREGDRVRVQEQPH